ncbi:MAG TPA: hypothetical protein VHK00_03445 [Miltoncostaeaceae bacterium]|nr:hypothetical protein [Miltoncostaeaceae bacterium]
MAVTGPRRRRTDGPTPRQPPFGPAPAALGPPDPQGLLGSLGEALRAARRQRRPMTLVCLGVPADGGPALERVAELTRNTVRDTDAMWRDGERGLALLLADADGPTSEPALARLRLRLRGRGLGTVTMGRAAPPPGIGAEELLLLARADRRPVGGR